MQSVQLSSINSSHLALTCQSITFIQTQILIIKQYFNQTIDNKYKMLINQSLTTIYNDYQIHHDQILKKIIEIVNILINSKLKQFIRCKWFYYDQQDDDNDDQQGDAGKEKKTKIFQKKKKKKKKI